MNPPHNLRFGRLIRVEKVLWHTVLSFMTVTLMIGRGLKSETDRFV
jgi:hypothetical protein